MRVLVVDDDEAVRSALTHALHRDGYEVSTAGDGAAALATARRIAKILKTIVGQMDVLETMTPRQFASFRPELGDRKSVV